MCCIKLRRESVNRPVGGQYLQTSFRFAAVRGWDDCGKLIGVGMRVRQDLCVVDASIMEADA